MDRYIQDAKILGRSKENDIRELIGIEKATWNERWHGLKLSGDPLATRGNFVEPLMPVMVADQTAVVGTAEAIMWSSPYGSLAPNFFDAPGKTVRLRGFGIMTTGATPGTATFTPRFGTSTGGTSLGAGTASGTLVASQTAVPFFFDCKCVCSLIGTTGQIAFFGIWESVRGYTTSPGAVEIGAAARTTVDTTATAGLVVGGTFSNAGTSMTVRSLTIESLN